MCWAKQVSLHIFSADRTEFTSTRRRRCGYVYSYQLVSSHSTPNKGGPGTKLLLVCFFYTCIAAQPIYWWVTTIWPHFQNLHVMSTVGLRRLDSHHIHLWCICGSYVDIIMRAQMRPHSICQRLTCYKQKFCLIDISDHEYLNQYSENE